MSLSSHPLAHHALLSRADTLSLLSQTPWCDVLIVGGGIHGATFAHLSALHGLRTVLIEARDFASGTSSRSSKLAHGGIRYLEHFDLRQVFEGIRERENLIRCAPHLVHSHEFVAASLREERVQRAAMRIGLTLYAGMALGRAPLPQSVPRPDALSTDFGSGVRYVDGIMADTRLVIERILAARQEGAHCLNYCSSTLFLPHDKGVEVRFRDTRADKLYSMTAGIVVNAAGPWIAEAGGPTTTSLRGTLRFSRGAHLLFPRAWEGPALVLPLREGSKRIRGRYYFITPHPAGTLVGTTEREVERAEFDPLPSSDELEELYSRLKEDWTDPVLLSTPPHYCFAGVRALPFAEGRGRTDELSRRHRWHYRSGVLTLIGGKYTTAGWTCEEGFRALMKARELKKIKLTRLSSRPLPGAYAQEVRVAEFLNACADARVPSAISAQAIARLGGRVGRLLQWGDGLTVVGECVLKGELRLAIDEEQAETVEDVLRRRVESEYQHHHGFSAITETIALLGTDSAAGEGAAYRERIASIQKLLKVD